jgi:hypothetical protein
MAEARTSFGMSTAARWWGDRTRSARHLQLLSWCVLLIAFLWRAWVVHHAVPSARVFHDTKLYFSSAQNPLFSRGIWAGDRSPVPLLFFKGCHNDTALIRDASLLLSVLGWLALAAAVARSLRFPVLRILGAFLVLWLASSHEVVLWNDAVLSESLSFTTAALFLASAISFFERPKEWLAPLVLTAALFGLCRDSNAYLVLMLGLLWLAVAIYRAARQRASSLNVLVALAFVAIFLISNASTNKGERWQYPLTNVIVSRVLPDPSAREQFVALGMPSDGLRAGRPRRSYNTDKRLKAFQDWVATHGKRAYMRYLAGNPRYLLSAPLVELPSLLGESLGGYDPAGMSAAWPWQYDWPWLRSGWWVRLAALPALCAALLVLFGWRARVSPLASIGITLAVLLYPHALVIWHGDAMEVVRHGLQVAFQLELALICLVLAVAEAALARRSMPKR